MVDLDASLTNLFYALIIAIATITVRFLVLLINKGVLLINEKIDTLKNENLKQYCKEVMEAAETMKKELVNGSDKKKWVTQKLYEYATEKNIAITEEQCSNMIQAIFQELDGITLNKEKTLSTDNIETIISDAINNVIASSNNEK